MALIRCPDCGYEVSNTAHKCVNCGYQLKNSFGRTCLGVILLIFGVLLSISSIISSIRRYK